MPTHSTVHLHVTHPGGSQTILHDCPVGDPTARQSEKLTDILRRQGLPLNTRCGQHGLCDGCLVELTSGSLLRAADRVTVSAKPGSTPTLKACDYVLSRDTGDVTINVPARSLLAHEPVVLSDFKVNVKFAQDPLIPTQLPPGAPAGAIPTGVAIDIGTTTVAVLLVDLRNGKVLSKASAFNRQMHLGDDVVTRINLCSTDATMLGELQKAVGTQTILPLIREAVRAMSEPVHLCGLAIAGNTTMLHLLAGVDPTPMGVAPFTPRFTEHREIPLHNLGLAWDEKSELKNQNSAIAAHLLPAAAAYIGADIVAGAIASGLIYDQGPSLLVDVGTNGEIVLKHGSTLLGCATAAGPAFEGARLHSGIRAGRGAISQISLTTHPLTVHTHAIGHDKPIGLCGSAYIDFLSEGRRVGLLTPSGRFEKDAFSEAQELFSTGREEHILGFKIAQGKGGENLLITEVDVSALLQAKAAIAAGILTLLQKANLQPSNVKRVYLAGGFGTHMNHHHAIACGLLPGFTDEQVNVVGNSSLAGAYLALMDRSALDEMKRIAKRIEIVELNLIPEFEMTYIDQLSLP